MANRVDELDATTGETLRTLVLAGEVTEDEHLHWVAPYAYVHGSSSRFVGTRGRYALGGHGQVVALHPVPIVVTDDAVVALDPEQLGDG